MNTTPDPDEYDAEAMVLDVANMIVDEAESSAFNEAARAAYLLDVTAGSLHLHPCLWVDTLALATHAGYEPGAYLRYWALLHADTPGRWKHPPSDTEGTLAEMLFVIAAAFAVVGDPTAEADETASSVYLVGWDEHSLIWPGASNHTPRHRAGTVRVLAQEFNVPIAPACAGANAVELLRFARTLRPVGPVYRHLPGDDLTACGCDEPGWYCPEGSHELAYSGYATTDSDPHIEDIPR